MRPGPSSSGFGYGCQTVSQDPFDGGRLAVFRIFAASPSPLAIPDASTGAFDVSRDDAQKVLDEYRGVSGDRTRTLPTNAGETGPYATQQGGAESGALNARGFAAAINMVLALPLSDDRKQLR